MVEFQQTGGSEQHLHALWIVRREDVDRIARPPTQGQEPLSMIDVEVRQEHRLRGLNREDAARI